ncbi:efflux RND transporter periplasmic adaptor subunit [Rhodopseudomonas palustris]|nr:efflux RND transporter periplasmic adaptor subunit [Rhodopseudomonas palustris]
MRIRDMITAGACAALLLGAAATPAAAATLTVAEQKVSDEKAVFATVESISVVPARSRIGGTVIALKVREGDSVARGQEIATIGDDKLTLQMNSLDAQMQALLAQASQAQIDFDRTSGLVERGTLARTKLDEARTTLNVAENNLRAKTAERAVVQQQFKEGQVLAPDDGRVLKKMVAVGSVVLQGDTIVTVAQQHYKLRLRVPERHARFLKQGDRVRVDGAEFGDHTAKFGTIDLVYPLIEDGRVVADASVEGLGQYFVGDRLRVWVSGGERPAFVIPSRYIKTEFGIDYVQLGEPGKTVAVPVQRGRDHPTPDMPDGLEILSGLRNGDRLVQP